MTLMGIFTRRDPATLTRQFLDVPVLSWDQLAGGREDIEVLILCGGSKTDLPEQGPQFARNFHTVDSFDTHAEVPKYFSIVDDAARAGGNVALIAPGWEPGLSSLQRGRAVAAVSQGGTATLCC